MIQLNRGLDDGLRGKNPTVVDVSSQSAELPTRRKGHLVLVRYCLKSVVRHEGRSSDRDH